MTKLISPTSETSDRTVVRWMMFAFSMAGLAIGWFLVGLLMPSLITPPEVARRIHSRNNLRELGIALFHYHDEFQELPPPFLVNDQGERSHSWAVLLLPYLDQERLFESIDLDQPFNTPGNLKTMAVAVPEFRNPMISGNMSPSTDMHYAMSNRIFRAERGLFWREVRDGASNTFLAGEIAEGFQPWYFPGHIRDPGLKLNNGPLTFGSPYFGDQFDMGTQMLMLDGSVHTISNEIDANVLEALATPDGGEEISEF